MSAIDDDTLAQLAELADGCDPWTFRFEDGASRVVETDATGCASRVGEFRFDVDAMLAAAAPALVAALGAARAEVVALQARIDAALAWLAVADPHPETNGNQFRKLRAALAAVPDPESETA